jgi:hypothetical protein
MPILNSPPDWAVVGATIDLWHGCTGNDLTAIRRHGRIDPTRGRPDPDFGRGFYTTTIERQARQWAWQRYYELPPSAQGGGNQPLALRFRIPRCRLGALQSLHFVLGRFDNEGYWSLVHHCRSSTAARILHHNHPDPAQGGWYDVVWGPVSAFWQQRVAMADADQVSFHTDKAVDVLNDLMQTGNPNDFTFHPIP